MQLKIRLDLSSEQIQRRLLAGLDSWVKLGLLSEAQVQEIAAVLSEPVPTEEAILPRSDLAIAPNRAETPTGITDFLADESERSMPQTLTERVAAANRNRRRNSQQGKSGDTPEEWPRHRTEAPAAAAVEPQPRQQSWLAKAFSSLIEEISVLWLLFLGVFLVIVSSGVLAASQWDSFSAIGQYGILFAYTLAFWVGSLWSRKQENLRTTGRMLALTTMLLIPVNFWVMDRFGVLASPVGIGLAAIAAITLSLFPLTLSEELMPSRLNRINLLGLSWLHWGWGWAIWPVAATYLGTISTATNLTRQDRQSVLAAPNSSGEADSAAASSEATNTETASGLSFDVLTIALSILILLVRSLWVAQVPAYQLGLAAGICGWLLVWLTRNKHSRMVWERAGFGLLLLGWAVTASQQPPLQAIAISLLALSLLWKRLHRTWHRLYLLALVGVGVQTYGLLWTVVPTTFRDRLLTWLNTWTTIGDVSRVNWAGIGLFPTVLMLLALGTYLRRRQQPMLGRLTELLALVAGLCFAVLSLGNPFTATINLSLSTLTLVAVIWKRQILAAELITLAHGAGLLAIGNAIYYLSPELSLVTWGRIALGGAIAEFIFHVLLRLRPLQQNTWWAGLGFSALSYGLLVDSLVNQPHWLWLLIPVVLTGVAHHRRALHPHAAVLAVMGTLLLHAPWLQSWPIAIFSFSVATLCMGLGSRIWQSRYTALFTVGSALLLAGSLAFHGLIEPMENSTGRMTIFWVIEIWALWIIQRHLAKSARPSGQSSRQSVEQSAGQPTGQLSALYHQATKHWAALLLGLFIAWGTFIAMLVLTASSPALETTVRAQTGYQPGSPSDYISYLLTATTLLIAALLETIRKRPMEWRYWSLAWAIELVLVVGLWQNGFTIERIGIATLALAFVAQIIADIWVLKRPGYRLSWHGIPLSYTVLGWYFGHLSFQADTGFFTVAAGLLLLGIGRRSLKWLSYIGLAALSIGAYELLIYRLMQAEGGSPGDGITLLAALALGIAALYRAFKKWASALLNVSPASFGTITHLHWLLGSGLCALATQAGLSQPKGIAIWTGCSLLLAGYALSVGNRRWTPTTYLGTHTAWTWLGLGSALLAIAYDRFAWFPDRTGLLTWGGALAAAIGIAMYYMPWEKLGWGKPWRTLALWLPMLTLTITWTLVETPTLLLVAAFYAWMAKQIRNVRLSYLSILLFDLALLDYLDARGWLTTLILSIIVGLSVLYVAEVDPYFQNSSQKEQRHWLRILASGLVGVTALYQTESSQPLLLFAAIACAIGIAFVFAGLILKVRAFLYVGTATFMLQVVRVLWLFINDNSLILWAVGIVLGLLFIWVAATFESRRSQLSAQLSSWTTALESWD
ncbi:MAG: hypothetical protein ABG776_02105 [Cyanobacteria bacterium J06555_13]